MQLVANKVNDCWLENFVQLEANRQLEEIILAVAYVSNMDSIFKLASEKNVPLSLYALCDGMGNTNTDIIQYFLDASNTSWRLYLIRDFYHPKIMWFKGVGAYIGSANLSKRAWTSNVECGVWFTQDDLLKFSMIDELSSIIDVIQERSTEATKEILKAIKTLQISPSRAKLRNEELAFEKIVNESLKNILGERSIIDVMSRHEIGGDARKNFINEWNQGLTLLRKITALFDSQKMNWPSWVSHDVNPSIVQDQATEWFWDINFRKTGDSKTELLKAHDRNCLNPDTALNSMILEWQKTSHEKGSDWLYWMNNSPKELQLLLKQSEIRLLDEEKLDRIIYLCHSSREHARQISNLELGLDANETRTREERCSLFAKYLLEQRSAGIKTIQEVLEFVIWGDKTEMNYEHEAAARIWLAVTDPNWKISHLGVNILGELIGYARQDEFPPRNNRVSKTLYALGYSGINFS